MNICFVLEHFYPHVGGVETVFHEYAKRFGERGHHVRVVTSSSGGITGEKRIAPNVDAFYHVRPSWFGHPILSTACLREHVHWADVVHTTTYTAAPVALRAARRFDKPCVITVHEALSRRWFMVESNPFSAALFFAFESYVVTRRYDRWHAVSNSTSRDLEAKRIPPERIVVIHHGIDHSIWNPACAPRDLCGFFGFREDAQVFLYTGRAGKTKGLFVLLDAIQAIDAELDGRFRFGLILSVHPPEERARVEARIDVLGLRNRVRVMPSVPAADLPGLRKAAHAMVVPSLTEGFGFNVAESCALGVPVVTSDADAIPEVVSGRVLLFRRGSVDDLARALLAASRDRFTVLPARRFDWDVATDRMIGVYGGLCRQRPEVSA